MIYNFVIVGSMYCIPKLINHITSEPQSDVISRINSLRIVLNPIKISIKEKINFKVWDIGDLIISNAWMPFSIFYCLNYLEPMNILEFESWLRFILASLVTLEIHSIYKKHIG